MPSTAPDVEPDPDGTYTLAPVNTTESVPASTDREVDQVSTRSAASDQAAVSRSDDST